MPAPERPLPLVEDSIQDEPPNQQNIAPNDNMLSYRIISASTIRRKDKLFDNIGYFYVQKREYSDGSIVWRCSIGNSKVRYCPATVTQSGDDFTRGPGKHCHPHIPGSAIAALISKEMKETAKQHPFKPAGTIINELLTNHLTDHPCPSLRSQDRLTHTANYCHHNSRPKNPTGLKFDLQMDHVPEDFLRADIKRSDKRHLLFTSSSQLNDHAKQLPLMFCLMSGKSKKDYKAVLKAVIDSLPQTPSVQRIVLDFEAAMWTAAQSILPDVELQGCAFHWTQVQDLGLKPAYMEHDDTHKFIRKLMALSFIPDAHIPGIFHTLAEQAPEGPVTSLVDYIHITWMESTVWPPEQWSVYFQTVRTNNDLEGWHHALNKRGCPQMEFYLLLLLLHEEANLLTLQVRLVSEKKLKCIQRMKYRDLRLKSSNTGRSMRPEKEVPSTS